MEERKDQHSRGEKLLKLFFSMLYISAFTFGGGFVIVTFMKRKFVEELHWIDEKEMLDMTALAQSSPGSIAVNIAILIVAGFLGMVTAVLGTVIPPMVILSVISLFYEMFATNRYVSLVLKGMQSGVAAVILDVAVGLGQKVWQSKQWVHIVVMAAAFAATFFFNINVVWIILAAAVIGIIAALLTQTGAQKAFIIRLQSRVIILKKNMQRQKSDIRLLRPLCL